MFYIFGLEMNIWNANDADFDPKFSNLAFILLPSLLSILIVIYYSFCKNNHFNSKYYRKKDTSILTFIIFCLRGILSISTIFFKRGENSYDLLCYCLLAISIMSIGAYDYISEENDTLILVDALTFFITITNMVQLRTNTWIFLSTNWDNNSDDKIDSLFHIFLFVFLFLLSLTRCVNNICSGCCCCCCSCCCRRNSSLNNSSNEKKMLNVNNAQYEQINDPLSSEEEDKKRNSHNNIAGIKMICEDEANLFQLFYFCWIVPMLRIGFGKERLNMDDLPSLASCDEPINIYEKYINIWEKQYILKNKTPSLIRILHKTLGYRFWKGGFLLLLGQTAAIFIPIITHELLTSLETRENKDTDTKLYSKGGSLEYLILLVLLLTFMSAMQSILTHQFWIVGVRVSMHSKMILQTHILDHVMNLSHQSRSTTTEGEMSNLVSSDASKIANSFWGCMVHWGGWCSVGTIVIAMYNLHSLLGFGAYAGVLVILLFMPTSYYLSQYIKTVYKKMMSYRDKRGKRMVENLRAIRILKAFTAETAAWNDIDEMRTLELKWQRYQQFLNIGNIILSNIGPVLVNAASFMVFSFYGGKVTAAKIFTSLLWFTMLQGAMTRIPGTIITTMNVFGSLERLEKFLLLDKNKNISNERTRGEKYLKVENCSFGWYDSGSKHNNSGEGDNNNIDDDAKKIKSIVHNVTFNAKEGDFICLVGPVGCGKSSILAGLTSNNVHISGKIQYNGDMAYVTQRPWLRNASILENIIDFDFNDTGYDFNNNNNGNTIKVDETKLNRCIDICALQADLDMFEDGIDTLVGSNGVTLSGGQRQRISLARAMYSDADIYIFDDVLSAVDENVGKHIFNNCIVKNLIEKKKIVILATHAEQYIKNNANVSNIYTIDITNGKFINMKAFTNRNSDDEEKVDEDGKKTNNNNDLDSKNSTMEENKGKKNKEKRKKGYVSFQDIKQYIHAFGIFTTLMLLVLFIIRQLITVGQQYWLTIWVRSANPGSTYYVYVYGAIGLILVGFTGVSCYFIVVGSINGARIMHDKAMKALLCSRITFFDTTPFGVIVNRMLNDIAKIDSNMSRAIVGLAMSILQVFSTIGVVVFVTPFVIIMVIILIWPYYLCGLYYRWSSRELRRLTSTTRSPIITNFSETVDGMDIIRAYHGEDVTFHRFTDAVRRNARAYYMFWVSNQWVSAVLDAMGVFIIFISTGSAVYLHLFQNGVDPALIGFCLTYTLNLPFALMWLIRNLATAETELVAVERIVEYSNIEKEDDRVVFNKRQNNKQKTNNRGSLTFLIDDDSKEVSLLKDHAAMNYNTTNGILRNNRGCIKFQNVTMKYRKDLTPVLQNVSFEIPGGKKVAVIGRTGAGKTSIFMALLRFYECEQHSAIYLNDKNIVTEYKNINDYRKHIAYVPQEAILFSGTIRASLTKNREDEVKDEDVWGVLEKVKMRRKIQSLDDGLDTEIVEGGKNFSHGERQLLCLARALLNKEASIVLADEATASVDNSNELLIQQVILNLPMTVLYICHRLVNLNQFDLLMIMEDGKVKRICKPEDRWS